VDPFTGETRPIALIYGEVRAKLAMGDEDDPMAGRCRLKPSESALFQLLQTK
jgi:hypothetical protein